MFIYVRMLSSWMHTPFFEYVYCNDFCILPFMHHAGIIALYHLPLSLNVTQPFA